MWGKDRTTQVMVDARGDEKRPDEAVESKPERETI